MKKVMLIFGTRPEAIKMCPLVLELKRRPEFETVVCVTGQHREMLDQILQCFQVTPQYDLAIMRDKQTLFDVTVSILEKLRAILESEKPDVVLVHGDTSTAFVTALACFYLQIPVGHVEAGLRTYNLYSPFPEEFNRQAVDLIARFYFAPTELSRQNLLKEGKPAEHIFVTGNTVIDALDTTVRSDYTHPEIEWARGNRLILLTAHRRENLSEPMREMFRAIRRIVGTVGQLQFEVIQYRLENEYNAKCRWEPVHLHKACWIEADDEKELENFKKRKYQYMAKDIEGRDVFLADSGYVLSMAQQDFEHIKFHFTSEF